MFEKRDLFKLQRKDLFQNLAKKLRLSIYGGNFRKDINDEYKCVTETRRKENSDSRVKEWFRLKNGNLDVKLEGDKSVDDYNKAKSLNTMPSHFDSYILSYSKKMTNDVFKVIGGFLNISFYYTDTDFLYIHKKHWSELVDNGFVGKFLGLGRIDFVISSKFLCLDFSSGDKNCHVIDDFDVILAERFFKGYSQEHEMIKLNECISFSEELAVSGRISIDWTKTFEGKKYRIGNKIV